MSPCCDGKAPENWIPFEEISGDFQGNGFVCSPECCTAKVQTNYDGTFCEPCVKPCPCINDANCCSPPCCAAIYIFYGCCGLAPGSMCCPCPTAYTPLNCECNQPNMYKGVGTIRFADKDRFYMQLVIQCLILGDCPCGCVRKGGAPGAAGAPGQPKQMERV